MSTFDPPGQMTVRAPGAVTAGPDVRTARDAYAALVAELDSMSDHAFAGVDYMLLPEIVTTVTVSPRVGSTG
jgi:hypothetical protein